MPRKRPIVYPYIPNSVPETRSEMLEKTGVKDVEELYAEIPKKLRFKRSLKLPKPLPSKTFMRNHSTQKAARNDFSRELKKRDRLEKAIEKTDLREPIGQVSASRFREKQ